jgi:hypothetical protein
MSSTNPAQSVIADMLVRLQECGELPPDSIAGATDNSAAARPKQGTQAAPTAKTTQPEATATGGHDDADVQEYMNRLLNRGNPTSPSPAMASATPTDTSMAIPIVERPAALKPEEYLPKSIAPEKNTNLDALREVAMQSNRTAIAASNRRRHKSQSMTYFAVLVGTLAFSGIFFAMSSKSLDVSMLAGIGCLVLSSVPAWLIVRLRRATRTTA